MAEILLFNKPFQVLCQFTDRGQEAPGKRLTLADFINLPGIYPAGRLDRDSEGLLVLTDDGALQARISDPKHKLAKTYRVQVEGEITDQALRELSDGFMLKDGRTRPAKARRIADPGLWERDPPIRYRANIPTSWLELSLFEGKNRQVRRMTAAVGFPTLRLVRWSVGEWTLEGLKPGEYRVLELNAASVRRHPDQTRGR